MGEVSTIGVDIAKSVFQVHGVDADGTVVIRRRVGRAKVLEFFSRLRPCLVGMEACATAHHWARELKKLGHDARLMPPTYVKAYLKRGKNDAADAAAICEAVTRPSMRFVPIKSVEQQSTLMLHRTRDLLIRQRTQLINALRAHLAELGLVAAKGREGLCQLVTVVTECGDERLPSNARFACQASVSMPDRSRLLTWAGLPPAGCEVLTPCRGQRPHHVQKDRIGTWGDLVSGRRRRVLFVYGGPHREGEEPKPMMHGHVAASFIGQRNPPDRSS
jgi:Transposase